MSPPPRHAVAGPAESTRGRLRAFVDDWKLIILVLVGAGAWLATQWHDVAKTEDLRSVARGTASSISGLQSEAHALEIRMAVVETGLAGLSRTLEKIDAKLERLGDQALEIAKTTGARQVALPPEGTP